MYISDCNYHRPKSVAETIEVLNSSDNAAILAGGTDILVEIKKGIRQHSDLVSLSDVSELKIISEDKNNVYIGTAMTHNEVIKSDVICKFLSCLSQACSKIGSEQVRNMATIGGNICTAASCCDTAPVLLAYNASIEIVGKGGKRTIPLKDFFVFNKKTTLKQGEIVTKIIVPKPAKGTGVHYEKFGLREAMSISVVSVAVNITVENNSILNSCVVIGAVAPTPRISKNATDLLNGSNLSDLKEGSEILEKIGQAASNDSIPIDDIRGGAQYRRDILTTLTQRAILSAIKNIK
ncbi:MAG: hypothetical protein A2X08_11930 [Bacteroidetes bacterium GWA2_32_17]|nr:MAG: hypothetical protein A2X08_11930 [Bacteroidetes bacterium GWA2_32_17]